MVNIYRRQLAFLYNLYQEACAVVTDVALTKLVVWYKHNTIGGAKAGSSQVKRSAKTLSHCDGWWLEGHNNTAFGGMVMT